MAGAARERRVSWRLSRALEAFSALCSPVRHNSLSPREAIDREVFISSENDELDRFSTIALPPDGASRPPKSKSANTSSPAVPAGTLKK
jgi:hypothetical protein